MRSGYLRLFLSKGIIDEIADVLSRPKIRQAFVTLTDDLVDSFLERLQEAGEIVHSVPKKFTFTRDRDDEQYVNLAGAVNAHYLVSRDKDLLSLNTGHTEECKEFRQRFRPLKVIEPLDLLREAARRRNLTIDELRAAHEQELKL
ncbi:MAG: putative toxin-antitoxin system toxin component, PIN family [Blastocatellia bacterium]